MPDEPLAPRTYKLFKQPTKEEVPSCPVFIKEQCLEPFIPTSHFGEALEYRDKLCHVHESTSTTDTLSASIATLDDPDDQTFETNSTLHEIQLQDTSSVEIEFICDLEEHGEHTNLSSTNGFLDQHDYELFLLGLESDTPSNNLNYFSSIYSKKLSQEDSFITHATSLGRSFALPHLWNNTTVKIETY